MHPKDVLVSPPVSPSPSTAAWLWLLWALQARLPCASLTVLGASTRLSTSDTPSRPCKVCDDVTLLWNVVSDQVLTSAFLSVSPAPALAAETQTDVAGSFSLFCSLSTVLCRLTALRVTLARGRAHLSVVPDSACCRGRGAHSVRDAVPEQETAVAEAQGPVSIGRGLAVGTPAAGTGPRAGFVRWRLGF